MILPPGSVFFGTIFSSFLAYFSGFFFRILSIFPILAPKKGGILDPRIPFFSDYDLYIYIKRLLRRKDFWCSVVSPVSLSQCQYLLSCNTTCVSKDWCTVIQQRLLLLSCFTGLYVHTYNVCIKRLMYCKDFCYSVVSPVDWFPDGQLRPLCKGRLQY